MRARAWLRSRTARTATTRTASRRAPGVFFDVFRKVDVNFGVCKRRPRPAARPGGHELRHPAGQRADSILSFRCIATDPGARMPPIARSVVHDQRHGAIVDDWITSVIDGRYKRGVSRDDPQNVIYDLRRGPRAGGGARYPAFKASLLRHEEWS